MLGYVFLGLAILFEFAGTVCMKLSDGFSNVVYSVGTLVAYGCCTYFLALALKTVNLNIAYATWCGLGIVLATSVSYFYFHESISIPGLIGIIMIVIGVVLCNFYGAAHG